MRKSILTLGTATACMAAVLSMASVLSSESAKAATVTFDTFATTDDSTPDPTPLVTVDDNQMDRLSFAISSSGTSGNLTGAFFNVSDIDLMAGDILNESAPISDFETDTKNVGGGVNIKGGFSNGENPEPFDFGFAIAEGQSPQGVDVSGTPFTFQIDDDIVGLEDVERVALRFQTVGANGAGSSKLLSTSREMSPIPLPAGGLLLLSGLGGMAALRRKQKSG